MVPHPPRIIASLLWAALSVALLAACDDGATTAPTGGSADVGPDGADTDGNTDGTDVGGDLDSAPPAPDPRLEVFCQHADAATVEARIDDLLSEALTLEQKVGLMSGGTFLGEEGRLWPVYGIEELNIPGLVMIDGPRGANHTFEAGATAFPTGIGRGATWDVELERRVGAAMAIETRAVGADVLLAPTVNVLRHPRWGRAQETYGEDPTHIGMMAVGFIEGVQSERVIASVKHYAVNSIEDTRHDVDVQIDDRTLREIYLPQFRRSVIEANVGSVMSAYNQVNGAYCAENAPLLREILKEEWGFKGFVESDWVLGTKSTVPTALAGLDIEMPVAQFYGPALLTAVESGEVEPALIDEAARRILRTMFCFALDTDPPQQDFARLETPESTALAREVAERSAVLLKNNANVLPLAAADLTRVAVLGALANAENIGDTGSSAVRPSYVVTALQGLTNALPDVELITVLEDRTLDDAELANVSGADVIVVIAGLDEDDEGESTIGAGDREQLGLRQGQVALIQSAASTGVPVVVVLQGGSAITMEPWLAEVDAALMTWYPGMEGGNSTAALLLGQANPSGRLPIVFPAREEDLPEFDNTSLTVTYGYFHGYRHLERAQIAPLFPFGYGLAYTTYALSDLTLTADPLTASDTLEATVTVTNTGDVAGIETVQFYIRAPAPSEAIPRPETDLKAFAQASLAPGESQEVTVRISVADLAWWDVSQDAWVVESGSYTLKVGHHAMDLPVEVEFLVR